MKKILVIAAAFFFFTGCSKENITPDPSLNRIDYFMIINNETDFGVVEYRVKYTDCSGTEQNIPLLMGEKIVVCVQNGLIKTNFANTTERLDNYRTGQGR